MGILKDEKAPLHIWIALAVSGYRSLVKSLGTQMSYVQLSRNH